MYRPLQNVPVLSLGTLATPPPPGTEGYLGGGGDLEASLRHAHLKPPNP